MQYLITNNNTNKACPVFGCLLLIIAVLSMLSTYVFAQQENNANNMYNDTIAQSASCIQDKIHNVGRSALSITTDKLRYISGEMISISGVARDYMGCPMNTPVEILVTNVDSKKVIYHISTFSSSKTYDYYNVSTTSPTSYIDNGLNADEPGKYNITTYTTTENGIKEKATTMVEIRNLLTTLPAQMSYVGMAFFGGLAIIISKGVKNDALGEILRFICLSGIALSPIAAFVFTDTEIGKDSPIGLVKQTADSSSTLASATSQKQSGESKAEWVMNIGGEQESGFDGPYVGGIQIPIYVLIFGIAGGYLRYLYKTAKLMTKTETVKQIYLFSWNSVPGVNNRRLKDFLKQNFDVDWIEDLEFTKNDRTINISDDIHFLSITIDDKSNYAKIIIDTSTVCKLIVKKKNGNIDLYQEIGRRRFLFYQSLEDVALFFLAPLLAMVVWFVLNQGGTTSPFAIAVVSFTIGLVTEEIIRTLIRFTRSALRDREEKGEETSEIELSNVKNN